MGVKEIFEKHFPYKDTKYVYDDNIVDEDNKTVSFEDYGDLSDMDQRLKDFTKDLENAGYKLNVLKGDCQTTDDEKPPVAADEVEYDIVEETNEDHGKRTGRPYKHTKELIKELNEPEEQVMADFQKSLDDYMSKNKKGREDIPATYKR